MIRYIILLVALYLLFFITTPLDVAVNLSYFATLCIGYSFLYRDYKKSIMKAEEK